MYMLIFFTFKKDNIYIHFRLYFRITPYWDLLVLALILPVQQINCKSHKHFLLKLTDFVAYICQPCSGFSNLLNNIHKNTSDHSKKYRSIKVCIIKL